MFKGYKNITIVTNGALEPGICYILFFWAIETTMRQL